MNFRRSVLLFGSLLAIVTAAWAKGPAAAQGEPLKGLTLKPLAAQPPNAEGLAVFDFVLTREDTKVEGVLIKPVGKGPFPAVVVNHGAGGNARGFGMPYCIRFAKAGYVAIACDYTHSMFRGGASATGGSPWNTAENRRRALACIEILQSLPEVDKRKIAMYGNSMGAFLTVVMCQETDKIKAAAITAGGIGAGGIQPLAENVSRIKAPFLILQGEQDNVVRPESAKNLKELLDKQGTIAELKMFPGVGHGVIREKTDEVFALCLPFFAKHLGAAPSATQTSENPASTCAPQGQQSTQQRAQGGAASAPRFTQYPQARPALGEAAPNFLLKDLAGKEVRLIDFVGKLPVVIEFGSYT